MVFPPLTQNDTPMDISPIIFGGAAFGTSYNALEDVSKKAPDALLSALKNGINTIDTSPFYTNSEELLGKILCLPEIQDLYPRESYYLITKAGRYGPKKKHFDYSRSTIISSVMKSCKRLKTPYFDAVYIHDVEFVAEDLGGISSRVGNPEDVLFDQDLLRRAGLSNGLDCKSQGGGDDLVLEAVGALFELKEQGVVRRVGISGYPLPTLLRISRLVNRSFGKPLDILLSYCHQNLQNSTLSTFIPLLKEAGVKQIVNASPLGMGLLRSSIDGPFKWHPAPSELQKVVIRASEICAECGTTLERVALWNGLGIRTSTKNNDGAILPTAVGISSATEVEEAVEMITQKDDKLLQVVSDKVIKLFNDAGFLNWSWASPPANS